MVKKTDSVTDSNNRLFEMYEDQLKKNLPSVKDYIEVTTKLTSWLGDPKAYYPAARPKIVQLVITAQMALRTSVGQPMDLHSPLLPSQYLHHPYAAGYVGLIKALAPFRDRFVEPSLKDDLTYLLKSVEGIDPGHLPPLSIPARSPQPPPPPSASSSTSRAPGSHRPLPTRSAGVVPFRAAQNKDKSKPGGQEATGQSTPTATTIQNAMTAGEPSPSVSTSPGDVRKLEPNPQRIPSPEIVFLGMTTNTAPAPARDVANCAPQPKPPSRSTSGSVSAPPGKPRPKKKKKVDITAFVQADLQDFKQKHAQTQPQASSSSTRGIKKEPETEQVPSVVGAEPSRNNVDADQTTHISQGAPQSIPPTPHAATKSTETNLAPPPPPLVATPATETTKLSSMGPPSPQNTRQIAPQAEKPPPTPTIQPLLIAEDSLLAQLFKWYEEYTSTEEEPQDTEEPEKQGEIDTYDSVGLADDMATLKAAEKDPRGWFHVVALTPGHAGDANMKFDLNVNEPTMSAISKWVNKSSLRLRDIKSSHCLSLGCYSSQDLLRRMQQGSGATVDDILKSAITSLPSAWPRNGELTLDVKMGDSRKKLSLTPPFIVTEDNFVDVSEFVSGGMNNLIIHQGDMDFTDFTFVLHIHNPTFKQLQQIVDFRRKEAEWKDWLVDVTRPLGTRSSDRVVAPPRTVA